MPSGARKAAWRFEALWTFPRRLVGSPANTDGEQNWILSELESELKRDLVERPTFPSNTSYVGLKYSLSDLDAALNSQLSQLPVTGYFQSAPSHHIDSDNLRRWFDAKWTPIEKQLGRNPLYIEWSRSDHKYQHVPIHGAAAIAKRGPGRKTVRVSLPVCFGPIFVSPCHSFRIVPTDLNICLAQAAAAAADQGSQAPASPEEMDKELLEKKAASEPARVQVLPRSAHSPRRPGNRLRPAPPRHRHARAARRASGLGPPAAPPATARAARQACRLHRPPRPALLARHGPAPPRPCPAPLAQLVHLSAPVDPLRPLSAA